MSTGWPSTFLGCEQDRHERNSGSAYAKRHLTLDEQIVLLKSRGLIVEDDAEGARWLGIIDYYRLSGYSDAYRQLVDGVRTDRFLDGTTLAQVLALYDFERRLKLLTLDALERTEIAVRSQVGFALGLRGTYAHLDPANLDGKFTTSPTSSSAPTFSSAPELGSSTGIQRGGSTQPEAPRAGEAEIAQTAADTACAAAGGIARESEPSRYEQWLAKIIEAQQKSREDFVEHFRRKYDGRLPVWVATEVLDVGGLSNLYAGLQHGDRASVAAHFGVLDATGVGNGKALANWMQVLNHVRNLCAHHSRLWNRNLPIQLAVRHVRPVSALAPLTVPGAAIARPFTPFLVIAYLLHQFEPDNSWAARLADLIQTALPAIGRHPREMGMPENWAEMFGAAGNV